MPFPYKSGGTFHRLAPSRIMQCTTCTLKAVSGLLCLATTFNITNESLLLEDIHPLTSITPYPDFQSYLSYYSFFPTLWCFFPVHSLNAPRLSSFSLHSHSAWWSHLLSQLDSPLKCWWLPDPHFQFRSLLWIP